MNESVMHDAKLEREVKKMLMGEEDKIQWGELLRTFCQLQKGRMEIALESLTKRQLDLLIDSAQTVKEDVQQSTLEAAKTELLRLGLTPEEFIAYLGGNALPSQKTGAVAATDKITGRFSYKKRFGKGRMEIIDEVVAVGKLTAPVSSVMLRDVVHEHLPQYTCIESSAWYSAAYEYNKQHGVSLTN